MVYSVSLCILFLLNEAVKLEVKVLGLIGLFEGVYFLSIRRRLVALEQLFDDALVIVRYLVVMMLP